jgi:RNA polymerase sigma factor (TIGR02999 family)
MAAPWDTLYTPANPTLSINVVAAMTELTHILSAIEQGDSHAAEQLLPLVYDELRRLAAQKLSHENPGQTLDATALVHEAYLRLVASPGKASPGRESGSNVPQWDNSRHFFAAAAEAMRRILVENARRKQAPKHGGDRQRQILDADALIAPVLNVELLTLDAALHRLAEHDPLKAKLVELRYFGGLTGEQAAAVLGISASSADRQWVYTRAWLRRELGFGVEA